MKLGVDLGGTKIEAIVLDHDGRAVWRERVATPQGDYDGTLGAIVGLVNSAKTKNQLSDTLAVGIGTPGALYFPEAGTEAVMKNSNSTALNGRPLLKDLLRELKCPVFIENDANCFALAEALSGSCQDYKLNAESVFGVILGTGVGGAIVIQQRLLSGRHHIAGEWGHNCLPAQVLNSLPSNERNRSCYCGRKDCIETYLSGPGFVQSYALRFQEQKDSKEIVHLMRQGESKSLEIWDDYLGQLAASLAQVVNILDPEFIVLGGGMSLVPEIYDALASKMQPYVFTQGFTTPILKAKLGDSAGVFGAAWLSA